MVTTTGASRSDRVWLFAVLPAVVLNLGAMLLYGGYYALQAVSPATVAGVSPAQLQFLLYLFILVVELAFAALLIGRWAAAGVRQRDVLFPGDRAGPWHLGRALALGVLFNAAMALYMALAPRLSGGWPDLRALPLWQRLTLFLAVPLQAAFCEELIWRGYLIPALQARGRSAAAAVVLSALSFALIHGVFLLGKLALTFALGLLTGAYYLRERRLTPLMLAHLLADLWSFGLLVW